MNSAAFIARLQLHAYAMNLIACGLNDEELAFAMKSTVREDTDFRALIDRQMGRK